MPTKRAYQKNPDKYKQKNADYYKENRHKWAEYRSKKTPDQLEIEREKRRERYRANPDQEKARSKARYNAMRDALKDKKSVDQPPDEGKKQLDNNEKEEW